MMKPKLPIHCPSCAETLNVSQLSCTHCGTAVAGNFTLPILLRLSEEEQQFMLDFFLCSGSLKELAVRMGNSYPTVRNRLDDIIGKISAMSEANK
jgi:hypothetical protein